MTLNVFGDNPTAIRLYETSGYTVTAQQMKLDLSSLPGRRAAATGRVSRAELPQSSVSMS